MTGDNLICLLERRLDNVVYRMGCPASHKEARQLVLHGHFTVNGKKVNIPSLIVKAGDVITMAAGCRHTVIAETELKLIEVQLGEDIKVTDKEKFSMPNL